MTTPAAAPREDRPVRSATVAAVLFLVLVLAVAGAHSYRDLERARERRAKLEASIAATEARVEALERRIHRLKDDPLMLERLAREELGLARPGEVVIVVPEDGS